MFTYPVGSKDLDTRKIQRTIHHAPVRVFRVSTKDSREVDVLTPFGDKACEIGPKKDCQVHRTDYLCIVSSK